MNIDPTIAAILIITVGISLLAFNNSELKHRLMMNPYDVKHHGQYYRLLTSGFIHNDIMHLFFNMFVFYSFGGMVLHYYEYTFDGKALYYFLFLYLGGIIFSDLPSYIKHQNNPGYNSLGASGAVSAVLFAYIFFNPLQKLEFMFIPIRIPGVICGILYLIFSFYMSKKGGDNINHDAHIFGAIYGVMFTLAMKPSLAVHFYNNIMTFFR